MLGSSFMTCSANTSNTASPEDKDNVATYLCYATAVLSHRAVGMCWQTAARLCRLSSGLFWSFGNLQRRRTKKEKNYFIYPTEGKCLIFFAQLKSKSYALGFFFFFLQEICQTEWAALDSCSEHLWVQHVQHVPLTSALLWKCPGSPFSRFWSTNGTWTRNRPPPSQLLWLNYSKRFLLVCSNQDVTSSLPEYFNSFQFFQRLHVW